MAFKISPRCIGCNRCLKNCPVMAIQGAIKTIYTINPKRCVECGVCANVCPVHAIESDQGNKIAKVEKEAQKKPVIFKEKCSACGLCIQECTFGCLDIYSCDFPSSVRGFAQLKNSISCVSCGLCQQICPMSAIEMQ